MPWSILEIKQRNKARGNSSRILDDVFEGSGGVYFVTSERFRGFAALDGERLYTVRRFYPETGNVETAGDFRAYRTARAAKRVAASWADGKGGV